MLWGPVGCGKSVGARLLVASVGYDVVALDGADGESGRDLVAVVRRVRQSAANGCCVGGARHAILLDDFESFTPQAAAELLALVGREDAALAPLLITCQQLRDPAMRRLQSFADVRLFAPSEHVCREWFERHHVWQASSAGARRRGLPRAAVDAERALLAGGDLRRCAIAMEWRARLGGGARLGGDSFVANGFEATRRLLLRGGRRPAAPDGGAAAVEEWARRCEPWDDALVQYHLPAHAGGDDAGLDGLARALDDLSTADASRVERYECSDAHRPYVAHLVGAAAHRASRAREVGALPPPPRLPDRRPAGARAGGPSPAEAPRCLLPAPAASPPAAADDAGEAAAPRDAARGGGGGARRRAAAARGGGGGAPPSRKRGRAA